MNLEEILNVIKPHYPNAIIDSLVDCITYEIEETEDGETKECTEYRISLKNDKILLTEDISEYYWDNYEKRYKFDMYDDSNHYTYTTAIIENNLFELKQALNIEVTWGELVEYATGLGFKEVAGTSDEGICYKIGRVKLWKFHMIEIDDVEFGGRTYYQMYSALKNLIEGGMDGIKSTAF